MSLPRRLAVLLAGLLVLAGPASAGAQQEGELQIEAVDARSFPSVSVLVTPPPHFYGVVPSVTVVENGVPRSATVRLLAQEPLQVILAVDTSGSMSGEPLAAAKHAARGFVTQLPPTTRVAVLGFAAEPSLASPFSEDAEATLAAIDALTAAGETALYDAVAAALEAFAAIHEGRPFVVLLSDGGDTVSTTTLAEAAALLEGSGIGFYAVELETAESDHAALETLAGITAGRVVAAEDPSALAVVYDQIASELANQLLVTYSSLGGGPTNLTIMIAHEALSASAAASITLPGTGPITTTSSTIAPTTTQPSAATTSTAPPPPTPYWATGPGPFGAPWLLTAGAAALLLAALIAFGMALLPTGRPPGQLAGAARDRFKASGGALTRLADRAKWLAESVLSRGGRHSNLARALDSAGVRLAAGEFVVLSLCACLVGLAVGALLWRLPGALIFGALGLFLPRLIVLNKQQKRRAAFAEQLDGTMQLLAGSLRAGYGLMQSVNTAADEAPSPTAEEFSRIMVETRLGRDLIDSLTALADRMASPDFRWVAQAIDIQRTVGGDLAEILDTVSQTIRERNQIRRQIRAL
ncbi:MAG: VWA domain-containing protein, partial [Actinomycetota bacterium]